MPDNDGLISEFYEDTHGHLENIEADVLKLEEDHGQSDLIDAVFRRVHSVKGNAGMLGIDSIRITGEVFETFLDQVRERKTATSEEIDIMFHHLDALKKVVSQAKGETGEPEIQAEETPQENAPPPPETKAPGEPARQSESAKPKQMPDSVPAQLTNDLNAAKEEKANSPIEADLSTTYLTFKLEDEHYGIDIMKVREIILKEEITPIPNTNSFVLGVMNLRDQIIPIYNLKERLHIEDYDKTIEEKNIIIVEIGKNTTGIQVDEVTGIVTLSRDKISPANDFVGAIPIEFLHGMGQAEDDTLILLNIGDLCDPEEKLF